MIIEIITMILQIVKTYTLLYKMYQRKSLSLSPPSFLSLSHLSPVTLAISLSTSPLLLSLSPLSLLLSLCLYLYLTVKQQYMLTSVTFIKIVSQKKTLLVMVMKRFTIQYSDTRLKLVKLTTYLNYTCLHVYMLW